MKDKLKNKEKRDKSMGKTEQKSEKIKVDHKERTDMIKKIVEKNHDVLERLSKT